MIDIKYANAFSEVSEIIFYLSEEEYNKIPNSFIQMIEENSNPEYEFVYDPNKTLDEQNVSIEAKTIIALICRDFLVSKEEKEEILEREKKEFVEFENEQLEKYNYDDLFKNNKNVETEVKVDSVDLVEYKKPFFKKIFEKILNFFKRNKENL